jgi:Protein of unknown function (DUF3752)
MEGTNNDDNYDVIRTSKHSSRKRSRKTKSDKTEKNRFDDDECYHRITKHTRSDERSKRNKKSKHRKQLYDGSDYDEGSSNSSKSSPRILDESSVDHRDRRSRQKKEHKKKSKKKYKKDKSNTKDRRKQDSGENSKSVDLLERNHLLANALCSLFNHHPNFASELPIILIRLGRGTTFDFSAMTDQDAAQRLTDVFRCLSPFGTTLSEDGTIWSWDNPTGNRTSSTNNTSELVLVRVVRALLDQIGITIEAVQQFENPTIGNKISVGIEAADNEVEVKAIQMLEKFSESNVASELAGICTMILEGEMINLDGIPDEAVKESLESLLISCGLEKSEMEIDESDDKVVGTDTTMGFGLPEKQTDQATIMLSNVINICHSKPKASIRRPIKGPMLPEAYIDGHNSSDNDDEGPLPFGAAATIRENILSKEQIKAAAARRAYELACAKDGIDIDPTTLMHSVREEWMVVPGKYDFLSSVQTGRSRTFASKSKGMDPNQKESIDPKIQAEIRSIREAYEETRGPSLMDQHREAKMLLLQQQQNAGSNTTSWKWNRDKDLDDGRRVDKDALGMILGNAGTDLKNKFQGGL